MKCRKILSTVLVLAMMATMLIALPVSAAEEVNYIKSGKTFVQADGWPKYTVSVPTAEEAPYAGYDGKVLSNATKFALPMMQLDYGKTYVLSGWLYLTGNTSLTFEVANYSALGLSRWAGLNPGVQEAWGYAETTITMPARPAGAAQDAKVTLTLTTRPDSSNLSAFKMADMKLVEKTNIIGANGSFSGHTAGWTLGENAALVDAALQATCPADATDTSIARTSDFTFPEHKAAYRLSFRFKTTATTAVAPQFSFTYNTTTTFMSLGAAPTGWYLTRVGGPKGTLSTEYIPAVSNNDWNTIVYDFRGYQGYSAYLTFTMPTGLTDAHGEDAAYFIDDVSLTKIVDSVAFYNNGEEITDFSGVSGDVTVSITEQCNPAAPVAKTRIVALYEDVNGVLILKGVSVLDGNPFTVYAAREGQYEKPIALTATFDVPNDGGNYAIRVFRYETANGVMSMEQIAAL